MTKTLRKSQFCAQLAQTIGNCSDCLLETKDKAMKIIENSEMARLGAYVPRGRASLLAQKKSVRFATLDRKQSSSLRHLLPPESVMCVLTLVSQPHYGQTTRNWTSRNP